MSVSEGHFEVAVPEELPEHGEIHAGHHQVGGEGVAQVVEAEILQARILDSGLP